MTDTQVSIPDLPAVLAAMRATITDIINGLAAGVEPSTSDWLLLGDFFCSAHLLYRRQHVLANNRGRPSC